MVRYAQCRTASLEMVELGRNHPNIPRSLLGDTPNRRRPTHRILVSFLPAPPPGCWGRHGRRRLVLTRRKCLTY